jgi:hypothetical protein
MMFCNYEVFPGGTSLWSRCETRAPYQGAGVARKISISAHFHFFPVQANEADEIFTPGFLRRAHL